MPVNFGIIGCGSIADMHAKAIAELRGARLVGCASRYFSEAKDFAERHGCHAARDNSELLALPNLDAVVIATPSGDHRDPAVAAAQAGKHVIVEKPLEITLARCDKIIAACQKSGVLLSTIFQSRFHRAAQKLKQAVDKGRFGQLSLGDAYVKWYRSQEYYDSGDWRGTWQLDGGGALMNQAIHNVDLLLWLMGPVVSVSAMNATLAHRRIEVEDTLVACLEFENGALGTIEATTASFPGRSKQIEIHGSRGSASLVEDGIGDWSFDRMTSADRKLLAEGKSEQSVGGASDPTAIGFAAHKRQLNNIVQAIQGKSELEIDGIAGRQSVELVLAIYQAAHSGRHVALPLLRDPGFLKRVR